MFTGLIERLGEIVERKPTGDGFRLRIRSPIAEELSQGDSLAVNGVCLTVIVARDGEVHADVGPETARVTTLGALAPGRFVNLERPLRADGRFGGHLVTGHIDATGYVEDVRPQSEFRWLNVSFPAHLAPYIVLKGSIALDGVSLTVAGLGAGRFDVQLVPYTLEHTTLGRAHPRDRVNLECDIIGKYVARVAELAGMALDRGRAGEVTH